MLFHSPFKQYQKRLADLYHQKDLLLPDEGSKIEPGSKAEKLVNEIDQFIEGEYSKAVFDYYVKKKPQLIRIRTGEEFSWDQAFGNSYANISPSLKHSLVGLVEGGGRFKLK